jgi:regulator of sigma E protease
LITILAFAFVLGVLVFVHELGHFLAAKRVGIRVLKFQLGFNPTIVSFRRGDTEYAIGALPLGGYVKMAGENPEDGPTGNPDEFLSKTKWQRFQVLIMGPVMNILLALILTALVLYQGVEKGAYEEKPAVVGAVLVDSPAAKADVRRDDQIVSVSGHRLETWEQVEDAIGARPNQETTIGLMRGGQEQTRTLTPVALGKGRIQFGDIGVRPDAHPRVPAVVPGDPAEKAGVLGGDAIVAVDGTPITYSSELRDAIATHVDRPITLSILRGGAPKTIVVTPAKHGSTGWIGISIQDDTIRKKPGAAEAVSLSVTKNIEYGRLIFQTLWGLFTRETSPKQLMGPIAIAQLSGETASLGWIYVFGFMASLSLNLGLLNLMPIPVLDGGHIFIMALEGLARRDFSMKVKEKMLLAGFVVILSLMVTVIYNDLTRISWIERLMPWR